MKITKQSKITLAELSPTQFGKYNGDPGHDVYTKYRPFPRALPTLQGELLAEGWQDVQSLSPVYHGKNGRLTEENENRAFSSDVLAGSSITRTSPQTMELLRRYKQAKPKGIAIAGGFDPTFRIEEWLNNGADIIVVGEADRTFPELMDRLTKDPSQLSDIKGIAFKKGDSVEFTGRRDLLTAEDLGNLPHPYYDEAVRKKALTASIETSRGCPNDCDFCSVSEFYGRRFRNKPTDYVLEELVRTRDIGRDVFFVDDNIAGNPKRAIELLEGMASMGLNKRWGSAQVTVKAAENPELLQALKKAKVRVLYVGVESINDASLKSAGKPYNAEQNKRDVQILKEEGFWVHGMMILGMDGDTKESLRETSDWMNRTFESVQLFSLTPLPGTKTHRQLQEQGRILTTDFSLYDAQNVVVRPKNLTPYELQTEIYRMYEDFYSPMRILRRFPKSPKQRSTLSIFAYLYLLGGKNDMLYSPQARQHMEFLKSVS
jgi:radical SAM superfamily enzyme YgiQ (UPF0313 family)